jgi:Flp pilus assembly pilin Flp
MKLAQFIRNFNREESGQDMLEYALVLAAVLAAVVAGAGSLSTTISTELTNINTAISKLAIPLGSTAPGSTYPCGTAPAFSAKNTRNTNNTQSAYPI